MPFLFPADGSPLWDHLGDRATVEAMLAHDNMRNLADFPRALRAAAKTAAEQPAVRRVTTIAARGDDEVWLISVGPRGGWKRLWNFGKGY